MERELVLRAKRDPEAFGVLFDYYYPMISRFVYKRVGSLELSKDITSEIFYQALKNLWRFRFMNRPFKAWLFKIAVAQIAQYYRRREKYREFPLEEAHIIRADRSMEADFEIKEQEDRVESQERFQRVHCALSRLPTLQHTIVTLRYFENKKIKEISEILGIKENTIKSHIRRALARLAPIIDFSNNKSSNEYVQEKTNRHESLFASDRAVA